MHPRSCLLALVTCFAVVSPLGTAGPAIAPEVRSALDGIQATSLRRDLSYISSDELQGRDSPSRGLDLAADYIAAQFRTAGLEPAVGDSYFQNASMFVVEPNFSNFQFTLKSGDRQFAASQKDVALSTPTALDLNNEPLFKLDFNDEAAVQHLTPAQIDGKVVIVEAQPHGRARAAARVLAQAKPALLIVVIRKRETTQERRPRQLVDPQEKTDVATPRVTVSGESAARFYASLKAGDTEATATAHIAAPHRTPTTLRNVIGVLRGSDPKLRDTYVFLTAHYDHLGVRPEGSGDRIYNGANDDGSGTVSVMEVARALGRLPQHPKRSIVFMTFFGEEEGLIGSEYYVHHPVFPLANTVADLNLEQVGRTDSTEGPQHSNASLTGFDYSDLTTYVQEAGAETGIKVYKNLMGSDNYFGASDNYSFAKEGVPAETLCVAFDYPDYHKVGDEWQKIDYDNMAKVDRAIVLATWMMADSGQAVHWNERNSKTAPYIKAAKQRALD